MDGTIKFVWSYAAVGADNSHTVDRHQMEVRMTFLKRIALVALPALLAVRCAELGASDKAMIEAASATAGEAKSAAANATAAAEAAARRAEAAARAAEEAEARATRAAAEAKAAGHKADRIFRKRLRK